MIDYWTLYPGVWQVIPCPTPWVHESRISASMVIIVIIMTIEVRADWLPRKSHDWFSVYNVQLLVILPACSLILTYIVTLILLTMITVRYIVTLLLRSWWVVTLILTFNVKTHDSIYIARYKILSLHKLAPLGKRPRVTAIY
jgi:energy-converting hydrogenase Eha subunit E